jgi:ABC-type Fe3+/spermidine/putrescine transport system ATPase subunit
VAGAEVRVTDSDAAIAVRSIVRRFGPVVAVDGVSLAVSHGEFVSLLGPSGCGKTTLLRIIAGLDRQDEGEVWVGGQEISSRPPHRRPVNLVFQRYALFPHKTVGDNVAFALTLRRTSRKEVLRRVDEMLELVRLPGFAGRSIDQLSGGQAQRVALARALIDNPPVLLLDEPLAALDLKLRQAMHLELREIQRQLGSTFIYVTHDQEDAFVMSDRVVLMNAGRVVQEGPPQDVYQQPQTLFASTFLGEANLFHGPTAREEGRTFIDADGIRIDASGLNGGAREGWVCIRPERISLEPASPTAPVGPNTARGTVAKVIFLGSLVRYAVAVGGREILVELPAGEGVPPLAEGAAVSIWWEREAGVAVER